MRHLLPGFGFYNVSSWFQIFLSEKISVLFPLFSACICTLDKTESTLKYVNYISCVFSFTKILSPFAMQPNYTVRTVKSRLILLSFSVIHSLYFPMLCSVWNIHFASHWCLITALNWFKQLAFEPFTVHHLFFRILCHLRSNLYSLITYVLMCTCLSVSCFC